MFMINLPQVPQGQVISAPGHRVRCSVVHSVEMKKTADADRFSGWIDPCVMNGPPVSQREVPVRIPRSLGKHSRTLTGFRVDRLLLHETDGRRQLRGLTAKQSWEQYLALPRGASVAVYGPFSLYSLSMSGISFRHIP